tara:strand:- start:760 stop:1686 length:927 start_codon:yes stop_codon:yes gene_type:complete
MALKLNNSHEVIVPAQTHVATAHAAAMTGAKIKFAEVDKLTGNILFSDIKKLTTKKTKCIIVVHMAGYPCEMDQIAKFCKQKKIFLIEDCAHALGTTFRNKHVGNFGVAGIFSFYPTKQITTGEGGMIISNNKKIINDVNIVKSIGVNTPPEKRKIQGIYDVTNIGLNYRLTDFQAALAIGQMKRYKKNLFLRQKNAKNYIKELKALKNITVQKFNINNSYFIFQILLKNKSLRNKLLSVFKKKGIGSSIHYATPVPMLSYYKKKYNLNPKNYKNAKIYSDTVISLPVHPSINYRKIQYISKVIKENI